MWICLMHKSRNKTAMLKMKEELQGFKRVPRDVKWMPREAVVDGCGVCMVGEAMEQIAIEGIDHMGWDAGSGQFIKTSLQDPPLMEMQVKVL